MSKTFEIAWDRTLRTPTLLIWHHHGLWSNADFDSYEAALRAALTDAAPSGFNVLLDQSASSTQHREVAARRKDTLELMIDHGMRRIVVVVPGAIVGMQSTRIAQDAGLPGELFVQCRTRAEGLQAVRDFDTGPG